MHKTKNIFTSLLFDSRTGRVWQVQYALDKKSFEGALQLSSKMLASESEQNGRFTLTATENIWTFLLTDTVSGTMWHCQFSVENKGHRWCCLIVQPVDVVD